MSESQKKQVQLRQSSFNGKRPLSTYVENDAKKQTLKKLLQTCRKALAKITQVTTRLSQ